MAEKTELAALLIESISHYRQIVALLQEVSIRVGTASPPELRDIDDRLNRQQRQAGVIDESLLTRLHGDPLEMARYQSLLLERASLLQEVVALNGRIASRARDVASLLVHEMETLRNSQSALSGYRSPLQTGGQLLNGVF